jgi:hypothetical protein
MQLELKHHIEVLNDLIKSPVIQSAKRSVECQALVAPDTIHTLSLISL